MRGNQQQQRFRPQSAFYRLKKRTGLCPHFLPGLGPESSAFDSATECVETNSSKGSDRSQHSSRPKKRTGLGPHFPPGLGPEPSAFDSAAECVEANSSKGSDRSQHSPRPKKRTGFGPHLCPQIRGLSRALGGYVRRSEVTAGSRPVLRGRHGRFAWERLRCRQAVGQSAADRPGRQNRRPRPTT